MDTLRQKLTFTIFLFLAAFFFSGVVVAKSTLKIVENKKVCMVTNIVFPKEQILVKHEDKSYYGCCENCKKTLSEDPKSRIAIDPVSNKPVDKATAVIAARADGSVIYFENQKTFKEYRKSGLN